MLSPVDLISTADAWFEANMNGSAQHCRLRTHIVEYAVLLKKLDASLVPAAVAAAVDKSAISARAALGAVISGRYKEYDGISGLLTSSYELIPPPSA